MKILGYRYTIRRDLGYGELGALGRVGTSDLVITVNKDIGIQQTESTLLHEIIEALNTHLGLEMPHHTIMSLEATLYQVLTENGVDLSPLLKSPEGVKK